VSIPDVKESKLKLFERENMGRIESIKAY